MWFEWGFVHGTFVCGRGLYHVTCEQATYFNVIGCFGDRVCVNDFVGRGVTGTYSNFGAERLYVFGANLGWTLATT